MTRIRCTPVRHTRSDCESRGPACGTGAGASNNIIWAALPTNGKDLSHSRGVVYSTVSPFDDFSQPCKKPKTSKIPLNSSYNKALHSDRERPALAGSSKGIAPRPPSSTRAVLPWCCACLGGVVVARRLRLQPTGLRRSHRSSPRPQSLSPPCRPRPPPRPPPLSRAPHAPLTSTAHSCDGPLSLRMDAVDYWPLLPMTQTRWQTLWTRSTWVRTVFDTLFHPPQAPQAILAVLLTAG